MAPLFSSYYETIESIGNGAFGDVYKVRSIRSGEVFALKSLRIGCNPTSIPTNPFREMKTLQILPSHPNIVQLHEVLPHECNIGLILEYCPNDLHSVLQASKGNKLSFEEVRSCMYMILSALDHLHSNSFMHRDIKPGNILVSKDGVLKLGDFGLARVYNGRNVQYTHQVSTRWYRAPELLFASKNSTQAIDIWSAGAVFAEMLLNRPLFPGENDIQQIVTVLQIRGSIEPEWKEVTELPDYSKISFPEFEKIPLIDLFDAASALPSAATLDLLDRMLTYDPDKRISAKEALEHEYFAEYDQPSPLNPNRIIRTGKTD